jgi:hypothetical protein
MRRIRLFPAYFPACPPQVTWHRSRHQFEISFELSEGGAADDLDAWKQKRIKVSLLGSVYHRD